MHGNVREWVSDWFGDYPAGAVKDPMGPDRGSFRVNRGGTWHTVAKDCRSARRKLDDPGLRYSALGFRLAMSPPIESALEADRK